MSRSNRAFECDTCRRAVELDKGRWCKALAQYVRPGFYCADWAEEQIEPTKQSSPQEGRSGPWERCYTCTRSRVNRYGRWCAILRECVLPGYWCERWTEA